MRNRLTGTVLHEKKAWKNENIHIVANIVKNKKENVTVFPSFQPSSIEGYKI
jgi:hypothetical protein